MISRLGLVRGLCLLGIVLYCNLTMISAASSIILTTSGPDIDALTNLTGGNTDRTGAIVEIDSLLSESPNGFQLSISSLNGGKLVREISPSVYEDSGVAGNVANYTMTLSASTGTLGCDEPTLPVADTLATSIALNFTQNVTADTVDKKYELVFTIPSTSVVLAGTFSDKITVTIADI